MPLPIDATLPLACENTRLRWPRRPCLGSWSPIPAVWLAACQCGAKNSIFKSRPRPPMLGTAIRPLTPLCLHLARSLALLPAPTSWAYGTNRQPPATSLEGLDASYPDHHVQRRCSQRLVCPDAHRVAALPEHAGQRQRCRWPYSSPSFSLVLATVSRHSQCLIPGPAENTAR